MYTSIINKNSGDYKIAKRVANILGIRHHFFELDAEGWLANLEKSAYLTDCHANIVHFHTMNAMEVMKQLYDIFLDGSLGEVFKGDYYFIDAGIESNNLSEYIEAVFMKMNLALISPEDEIHLYSKKAKRLIGLSRVSLEKNNIDSKPPQQGNLEIRNSKYSCHSGLFGGRH